MNDKILILGCGMQGQAAICDLYRQTDSSSIVVVDSRPDLLDTLKQYDSHRVKALSLNISNDNSLKNVMHGASLVVEALPPQFALDVARTAVDAGVNMVSSMYLINPAENDPGKIQAMKDELSEMDEKARAKGITILPEFGLDPGIDLVMGKKNLDAFDDVHTFQSYGTGIPAPEVADNPLNYKFSWSIKGVMRAYRRPATLIRQGEVVTIDGMRMFEPQYVHTIQVKEIGMDLECYPNGNTAHYADVFQLQGQVREMGRYACRYPGHCEFWRKLVQSGFLDEDPITVGDVQVTPLDFTASLLGGQAQFQFGEGESDFVMVRTDVTGSKNGKRKRILYQVVDRRDPETGFTAMQRTVGFTMGIGARLILNGRLSQTGLISPLDVSFDSLDEGLKHYGIHMTREEVPLES